MIKVAHSRDYSQDRKERGYVFCFCGVRMAEGAGWPATHCTRLPAEVIENVTHLLELEAYFRGDEVAHIPQNAMRIRARRAADLITRLATEKAETEKVALDSARKLKKVQEVLVRIAGHSTANALVLTRTGSSPMIGVGTLVKDTLFEIYGVGQ